MDVLALAFRACVVLFMVGSLAGVGLGVAPRAVLAPLRHARFVMLTLFVSWIVCPAIAALLLLAIPLERPYATGLLLLALSPCAPFAPAMARTARGDAAYMAAVVVLSAVSTVVMMPVAVPLLIEGLSADPLVIARPLALFVLLPLVIGASINGARPLFAHRLRPVVETVSNVAGVVLLLLVAVLFGRGVVNAVGSYAIATQVVYLSAVTIAAHVLGSGLPDEQRNVVTIGLSTRNLGAALAPLAAIDRDPGAVVMIVIGGPVTIALSALAARWLRSHSRTAGFEETSAESA